MSSPIRKQRARELAMQVLFLWDSSGKADLALANTLLAGMETPEKPDDATAHLAITYAQGAWLNRAQSDPWVERLAPQWPTRRQPAVDRNILRLAVWEMTHTDTPPKVVIDEAIELAKRFSTEHSPSFVNGVLDAVLREMKTLTGGLPPATEEATS